MGKALTQKQVDYCREYVRTGFSAAAAVAAGYSERTADKIATKLLSREDIQAEIQRIRESSAKRAKVKASRVLKEMQHQAFFDPLPIAMANIQEPADIQKLPLKLRRMIKAWKWDKNGNLVLEFVDRQKALDGLARHFSLYNDKTTVDIGPNLAGALDKARQRVVSAMAAGELPPAAGDVLGDGDDVLDAEFTVKEDQSDDE